MNVPIPDSVRNILKFLDCPIDVRQWADPNYYHDQLHQLIENGVGALEWLFFAGTPLKYAKRCLLLFTTQEDATGGWNCLDVSSQSKLGSLYRTHEKLKALPIWGTPQTVHKIAKTRATLIIQMLWEILSQKHWTLTTIHQDKFESWFRDRGVDGAVLVGE